jgi:biotin carboxyl carrier protein
MKKFNFKIKGNSYEAIIQSFEENIVEIDINGTSYKVELDQSVQKPKTPKLVRADVSVSPSDANIKVKEKKTGSFGAKVKSPLPGTIFKVKVKEGDVVKAGDVLLVLEAMKMENNILAETEGTVKNINVKEADVVLQDDLLMEIG